MKEQRSSRVVIGVDPHNRSVTIEVMRPDESVTARGRLDTDRAGYETLLEVARSWPKRVWAVEGCNGMNAPLVTPQPRGCGDPCGCRD